jgi:SAM-dependent methyltransferase
MGIDIRMEVPASLKDPDYLGRTFSADEISRGAHRDYVGGRWEALGSLQLDFLVSHGLEPRHRFLDVGCGSLRAGRHLVDYLEPGNYYGIDINAASVEAGYGVELSDQQRSRLQAEHLRVTDRFDADFGVSFDMAIAQSVFTHVSLNHVRLCLHRVAKVMAPGARFFATFFEAPHSTAIDGLVRGRYTERNVYWYYREDIRWAAESCPWEWNYIGDWGHPVGQVMAQLTRTP